MTSSQTRAGASPKRMPMQSTVPYLVFVVVPWKAFEDVLASLRQQPRPPKRIVSVVIPWTGDNALPAVGTGDSAAERLERALPDSRVAGAFTTVSAATIRAIDENKERPTVFVVSDDVETKRLTREVAESIGFAIPRCRPAVRGPFHRGHGVLVDCCRGRRRRRGTRRIPCGAAPSYALGGRARVI